MTGVVNYNGKSRAIWSTHPIEKPYLIYQIGSADPELAVKAAKMVVNDVSGIDLNCGCPKPFSTSGGMGAALLTNPDLLCSILTALRNAMPPEISVSAKIRLLPTQGDTLKLVERIVNTGVSALTVHCRTRNMRNTEKATVERLREIVEFVEKMGKGVAVIENGDCLGYEDAKRVKEVTGQFRFRSVWSYADPPPAGAHSVMIATAAEANPSCFSPTPLADTHRTLVPTYLRVVSGGITPCSGNRTYRSHSRGISITIGGTLSSAQFSSAETTSGPRERKRRSSRTSSQKPSVTTMWTMWRETGPKEKPSLKIFAE